MPGHGTTMPPSVASLIVRQALALLDEGIGPKQEADQDTETMREAIKVFRAHLEMNNVKQGVDLDCDLSDHGFITREEHLSLVQCERCLSIRLH